ncbi:hypothetical protein OF83DRAFT_1057840 [Amylostereum chailletii]|nr:hypothetical protein OF83DRAFT_1057840 [Amylostereum chailletii]
MCGQVGHITLDNASNNDTFMEAFEQALTADGIYFQRYGNRICLRHQRFREVVQEVINRNQDLRNSGNTDVGSVLNQVLELLRDVDTHWSSVLFMVQRTLLLCRPVEIFLAHPDQASIRDLLPTADEWKLLEHIRDFLAIPNSVQELMSGENTPNLSAVLPAYTLCMQRLSEFGRELPVFAPLANAAVAKFEEYFNRSNLS